MKKRIGFAAETKIRIVLQKLWKIEVNIRLKQEKELF